MDRIIEQPSEHCMKHMSHGSVPLFCQESSTASLPPQSHVLKELMETVSTAYNVQLTFWCVGILRVGSDVLGFWRVHFVLYHLEVGFFQLQRSRCTGSGPENLQRISADCLGQQLFAETERFLLETQGLVNLFLTN